MDVVILVLWRTPWWVWPLLCLTIYLGASALRASETTPARLTILPAVFTTFSLSNLVRSADLYMAGLSWLSAFAFGGLIGSAWVAQLPVTVDKHRGRIRIPGSAFWLIVGLIIFGTRYATGVYVGFHREARQELVWRALPFAISGLACGMSLSWWSVLMWRYVTNKE